MTAEAKKPALKAAVVTVTPFQQNCTLIWDEASKKGVVIDPGGELDRIEKAIADVGVAIEAIWLTHGHIDHAGGAADLRDRLDVKIIGPHRADMILLDNLAKQGRDYGMPARDVTPDTWLDEGDTVVAGGHAFEVLHCPGHSPGSVVFLNRANKFMVVGDVLFRGSIGRTDFPYGDHDALIGAIKSKLIPLGDAYAFVCGHGPGSTIGLEKRTNPFIQA
ncbi:MAG: MBL fold metallo-hydrolase [Hyphomicrobiaceae bacterium]|nr:MBL fold metallo-hydrolase [Hyphomicrobiaceae bacterium]